MERNPNDMINQPDHSHHQTDKGNNDMFEEFKMMSLENKKDGEMS